MTEFDAGPVLAELKGFQRRTVEHIAQRFYGPANERRFLVADETGLGKSIVARGVIARAIEHLQHKPEASRIDIVYVCSNADIARQNLRRLDVTDGRHTPIPSRLSLLAKHSAQLRPDANAAGKPINLVSFTPGTSFSKGWQTGQADERALIFLLLEEKMQLTSWERRAGINLLRDTVGRAHPKQGHDRFSDIVERLRGELQGPPDRNVARAFWKQATQRGQVDRFSELIVRLGRRPVPPEDLASEARVLIGEMRGGLSRAGLKVLQPDLVILDEFQRFKDLLDPSTPAGELAHQLFDYGQAKVLLLSATPYKPFTYAEESEDDHHKDFMATLQFLTGQSHRAAAIADDLDVYRTAALSGQPAGPVVSRLRSRLLEVMTRSERPVHVKGGMLVERISELSGMTAGDLADFVRLSRLSQQVDGEIALEYWKSTPYFANFCDGYQLSEKLRRELRTATGRRALRPLVDDLALLQPEALARYDELDLGNPKLRALAAETVDAGWWRLLWMPASLPYLKPQGAYAAPAAIGITKRLVFSSWSATPTAIAALLSHLADSRNAEGTRLANASGRDNVRGLLDYRLEAGRAGSLTTLALFWPMPGLAQLADPLIDARAAGGPVPVAVVVDRVARLLRGGASKWKSVPAAAAASVAFERDDCLPNELRRRGSATLQAALSSAGSDVEGPEEGNRGLQAHVEEALRLRWEPSGVDPAGAAAVISLIGAHAPGNIAWRALRRVTAVSTDITDEGLWNAAATLASALRTLFNRAESILLIERSDDGGAYWQKVLRYCAEGNLQAVLDEYLQHLMLEDKLTVDDEGLLALARRAGEAITLRSATYSAFNPRDTENQISLTSRFALRYGSRSGDQQDGARQPQVRQAFNSPFWPFVLASTSVGQEGIDFHWWCSAVVHWNTPANPVDFEQREGRVDRYAGHAVRRNLAHRHGIAMLQAENPWEAAFVLGLDEQATLGEFAPHWIYPGPAHIERHLLPYPLSVDVTRLEQLKTDLALYRLTFGQPRQEDMLQLLKGRGVELDEARLAELRVDLSAPEIAPWPTT